MKRTWNDVVKVWSHRRSGTNFLCGLLYINFYEGRNMTTNDAASNFFVSDTGRVTFHSKWGELFGGHLDSPPNNLHERCVYIKRNVLDTARSWYNRRDFIEFAGLANISFDEFVNTSYSFSDIGLINRRNLQGKNMMTITEYIERHHSVWEKTGVHVVQYEDLVRDHEVILTDISKKFGLEFVSNKIKNVDRKVGWFAE